jgi:hypothetical protein
MYAKASMEVCSSLNDADLQRIVFRIDVFRTINIFWLWLASANLRVILIKFTNSWWIPKTDVLVSDSVDAVLEGYHYNRGMSAQQLVAETIARLCLAAFLEWNSLHDSPQALAPLAILAEKAWHRW